MSKIPVIGRQRQEVSLGDSVRSRLKTKQTPGLASYSLSCCFSLAAPTPTILYSSTFGDPNWSPEAQGSEARTMSTPYMPLALSKAPEAGQLLHQFSTEVNLRSGRRLPMFGSQSCPRSAPPPSLSQSCPDIKLVPSSNLPETCSSLSVSAPSKCAETEREGKSTRESSGQGLSSPQGLLLAKLQFSNVIPSSKMCMPESLSTDCRKNRDETYLGAHRTPTAHCVQQLLR